jgi:hypothetical protein
LTPRCIFRHRILDIDTSGPLQLRRKRKHYWMNASSDAGASAGDALSSAGQALSAIDPEVGQTLSDYGASVHQYATTVKEDVAEAEE